MSKIIIKCIFLLTAISIILVHSDVFADDCVKAKDWFNKGYKLSDNSEREAFYYKKAIELCPDYVDPYIYLSNNYVKNEKYSQSMKVAKKGLKIDPYNPVLHLLIGANYDEKKKYKNAVKHYKKSVEYYKYQKHKYQPAYYIVRLYFVQNNYAEAYKSFYDLFGNPHDTEWETYARGLKTWIRVVCPMAKRIAFDRRMDFGQANEYHKLKPVSPWSLSLLAVTHARYKEYRKAIDYEERAIRLIDKKSDWDKNKKKKMRKECYDRLEVYKKGKPYTQKNANCPDFK